MNKYNYKKIDAFTAGSLGNPAACIYLAKGENLTPEQMQQIAFEHKGYVSEMVFCEKNPDSICLTYYSSECEVDFCGHGTIASMYDLVKNTPSLLSQKEIQVHTHKKGDICIYNEIESQDTIYISAPAPLYIGTALSATTIADALKIAVEDIDTTYPIDLIDAGLRTLIVPICPLQREITIFPNESELKLFCEQNGIDIILCYSLQTSVADNFAHTRVFAPKFGYLEDPATGSGNSAFGYYLLKNNLWRKESISLEQGGENITYNLVRLAYRNDKVIFGGSATTKVEGNYFI